MKDPEDQSLMPEKPMALKNLLMTPKSTSPNIGSTETPDNSISIQNISSSEALPERTEDQFSADDKSNPDNSNKSQFPTKEVKSQHTRDSKSSPEDQNEKACVVSLVTKSNDQPDDQPLDSKSELKSPDSKPKAKLPEPNTIKLNTNGSNPKDNEKTSNASTVCDSFSLEEDSSQAKESRPVKRPVKRALDSDSDQFASPKIRSREHHNSYNNNNNNNNSRNSQPVSNFSSSQVSAHYNAIAQNSSSKAARETLKTIRIRKFNNWIKNFLLKKASKGFPIGDLSVLDLGCGKGGDLEKWRAAGIKTYCGIDIADVAVATAFQRYKERRHRNFDAYFFAYDCFRNPIEHIIPPNSPKFDIVSMQFCLHYGFENEQTARQMLQNVAYALKRGGRFVGTLVNPDSIAKKFLAKRKLQPQNKNITQIGNEIYHIRFDDPPDLTWNQHYGLTYEFFLQDAVDKLNEFVVPFATLQKLADEYGMRCVERKTFFETFKEAQKDSDAMLLFDQLGINNWCGEQDIDPDEWQGIIIKAPDPEFGNLHNGNFGTRN